MPSIQSRIAYAAHNPIWKAGRKEPVLQAIHVVAQSALTRATRCQPDPTRHPCKPCVVLAPTVALDGRAALHQRDRVHPILGHLDLRLDACVLLQ